MWICKEILPNLLYIFRDLTAAKAFRIAIDHQFFINTFCLNVFKLILFVFERASMVLFLRQWNSSLLLRVLVKRYIWTDLITWSVHLFIWPSLISILFTIFGVSVAYLCFVRMIESLHCIAWYLNSIHFKISTITGLLIISVSYIYTLRRLYWDYSL